MNQVLLGESWYNQLKEELEKPYFVQLKTKMKEEYGTYKCCPPPNLIFRAFKETPFEQVRVVIISQDPYPQNDVADGLTFSTQQPETPFSLQRVFREVDRDVIKTKDKAEFKKYFPNNDLTPWARKGILLLNSCLTVRAGQVNSHHGLGWEKFIEVTLNLLQKTTTPKVFITFGKDARVVLENSYVENTVHGYFDAGHPASGAHGIDLFSGCNVFSKTNHFLNKRGLEPINWKLND